MSHLIQPEVQALLLDAKGKIPAALMDDDVIDKAVKMRDEIGIDRAIAYLEFKGLSLEGAMDVLKATRH